MAKSRNQTIYNEDKDRLVRLQEEYRMIGFDTQLEDGKLVIFALPRWAKSRKQKKQEAKRNKGQKRLTRPGRKDSL